MSEPISVRTEAINTLRTLLGQSTGAEGDVALDELSNELSSANTTTNTLANSIVSLKNSVALLKAQVEAIAAQNSVDISGVKIQDPDAPSSEEQTGSGTTVKYTVEKGTIETTNFLDDETHWIKHYTYDNLHIITYCLKTVKVLNSQTGTIAFKVATFSDLSSVPDGGNMGYFGNYSLFYIEGNNVILRQTTGSGAGLGSINKDYSTSGYFFWFDRSQTPKMFTIEDGYLVGANVATYSPNYAIHAYVGNLHFLTIHTKTIKQLDKNTTWKIAEFPNNLAIPNANAMGEWVSRDINYGAIFQHLVKASDSKTITISNPSNNVYTDSALTMNLIWIDSQSMESSTTIVNATSTSATSSDKYARYLTRGHFNVVQVYGQLGDSNTLASFADPVPTPDAEYFGIDFGLATYQGKIYNVRKTDVRTFYTSLKSTSVPTIYTYIWFT